MSRKLQESTVTREECLRLREDCTSNAEKVNLALFGPDGRGGIVKDIQDIKTKLESYSSVLRQFAAPIAVAVVVALIVRFLP